MQSLGLKQWDHFGPAGSIGPGTVDDDDVFNPLSRVRLSVGARLKHCCQQACNESTSVCLREFHSFSPSSVCYKV
jgi:hypothetical protein